MLSHTHDIIHHPPQVPALSVVVDRAPRWQAALIRAQEHGLAIELRDARIIGDWELVGYVVQSYSTPGLLHPVVIARHTTTGEIQTKCDCEAGTFARECQHAALAVDDARWWPQGMGIGRQLGLDLVPSNDELPRLPVPIYRPGQIVKLVRGRTLFVVTERFAEAGVWHYALSSLANVPVGSFAESYLTDATNRKRRVA